MRLQSRFLVQAPSLRGYAIGLTGDPALADDAVQECFLVVQAKAADFREGTDFAAWTRAILRRKVLELLRQRKRSSGFPSHLVDLLADEAPAPAVWDAERRALANCLPHLAPKARQLVELRYIDGLFPEAIAARVSWTANAVNVALSRAKIALRQCIQNALTTIEVADG
jgi:RNA polymerase sigma-70 factor, ECF subfamily